MPVPTPSQATPAPSKTMHGARAQLYIDGNLSGVFNQASWGVAYDASPVYILGRYSPAEIALTSQEPVSLTLSGWKIVSANSNDYSGPYSEIGGKMSNLQDLLNAGDITVQIVDRLTNQIILNVINVRTTGYSTSVSARGLEEITVSMVGLIASDESGTQAESAGASDLPPV